MHRYLHCLVTACVLLVPSFILADEAPAKPSVFDLPNLQAAQAMTNQAVAQLLSQGKFEEAEKQLRAGIARVPQDAGMHYNLGCTLARQMKTDEAFTILTKAIELGFRGAKHVEQDEDLKSLRDDPRFKELVKQAGEPLAAQPKGWNYNVEPAEIADGQGIVSEKNVAWNGQLGVFHALFKIDNKTSADNPIAKGLGKIGDLLRAWHAEGTAAGNSGDLYDNHDGDHSNMNFAALPQLTRIEYDDAAKKRQLHNGLQLAFFYNGVTLGNSSTALTSGPHWRCQARMAMTRPRGGELLYRQYVGNHIYFYPEHRDHDAGHNGKKDGYGDVLPANTPYLILSQGSSGSDIVFMNAVAATMAAFRPEVKAELVKNGLLMPTIQMIFRSCNKQVAKPEDYLTGKAHPSAFEGSQLDGEKMVNMAHDMTSAALPPLVQLKVVEEDEGVVGRDYFDISVRERLFDTPCAIARVVKSSKYMRRMVVSAEASKDLHGKPLTYTWAVLRGDAERIQIKKLNDAGSVVELLVPYHERRPIQPGSEMESNRVDIGAFVNNGTYYSAPGFVTFTYLDNEKRTYDGEHRIQSIDYTDPDTKGNYVDPLLDFPKDWRDDYQYSTDGKLIGWRRTRGEKVEEFTADGQLITEKDPQGQPLKTQPVRYTLTPVPNGVPKLKQEIVEPAK